MNKQLLQDVIEKLSNDIPVKNTLLVCSKDGDLVAQTDHGIEVDLLRVAVQAAAALGVSSHMGNALNIGGDSEISLTGEAGRIFIFRITDYYFLTVVCPHECNIALLNILTSRTINLINGKGVL